MKKIFLLCLVLFCSEELLSRQAGWYVPGSAVTTQKLKDIKALDANTAVAVGENGTIVRTTNGGTTWTSASSGTTATLTALHIANATTGWAVGYDRTILKTTDGGATWTSQFSTMGSRNLYDVFFLDASTGWTTGRDDWPGYIALVYKTTNGGTGWSSTMTGTSSNLYSIWFTSSTTGCAVGSSGVIRKTTDGGSSWSAKTSGTSNALYSVCFIDAQTGYATGLNGTIIKTTDGGESWSPLTGGTTQGLYAIDFAGSLSGWAVGAGGTILSTTDGGATWRSQMSGTSETLYGTDFMDTQKGWAVGSAGKILKTTSGGVITNDLGVMSIDVVDVVDPGQAVTVKVSIKNFGGASQSNFPVSYAVNGGTPVTETYSGTLESGSTGTKTFSSTWSSTIDGEYQFSARTQLAGDENSTNDVVPVTRSVIVVGASPPPPDPAGWFSQNNSSVASASYYDIHAFNAARAIAVGSNGSIMKTVDGGSTWEKIPSGVTSTLRGISFVGSQTGWVAGDNGTLLRTTDGGTFWVPLNSGTTKTLSKIQFNDANTGWVNEDYHNLRRTTDGGNTWQVKYAYSGSAALEDLRFVSASSGVIVGRFSGGYSLHRTTDGGDTWTDPTLYNGWIKSVHFVDALNGWASGLTGIFSYTTDIWGGAYWSVSSAQSTFWRTTDGGATWAAGSISSTAWLNDVRFADANTGWMIDSNNRILRTTDRGSSWTILSGVTSNTMRSIACSSTFTAWIVGDNNTILKTSDGGTVWNSKMSSGTSKWLQAVSFVDDQNGWAAGYSGTVVRTNNGGRTWSALSSGTTQTLNSIFFTTPQIGWIVGESGTIIKTTDAGNNWLPQTSGTTGSINSMFFSSNSLNGWCVGASGMILRTSNGGASWSSQTIGTASLYGVTFCNDLSGWAVGSGGTVLKTTDAGSVWTQQSGGSVQTLRSLYFVDPMTGWAVGYYGEILKSTDGGSSWTRQASRTDRSLYSAYFTNTSTGWIAGDGIVLKTIDGGNTWGQQTTGTSALLSSVHCRSTLVAWAVGTNGTIIKTSDGGGAMSLAPVTPALVSPADQLTKVPRNVTLSWGRASEATSYRLQVSKSSTFSPNVFDQSNIVDTSYTVPALDYGTKYYWRVSSSNTVGTTPWSGTWSFTTASAPPPAPTLSSPVHGATGLDTPLSITWSPSSGASKYRLQIAKDSIFSSVVFDDSTIAGTSATVGPLEGGATYYWRVRASNADVVSDWSSVRSFSTRKVIGPPVPTLSSPVNAATNLSADLVLQWNRSQRASSYRLQISGLADFSITVLDKSLTDTLYSLTGLNSGTTYYWRVNATDTSGTSAWSNVWRFTVGTPVVGVPAIPALLSPGNTGTAVSINPVITWIAPTGAVSYRLQVSTTTAFVALVFDDSTLTVTEKIIGPLTRNITYYWRVSAKNSAGNSDWSPVWSFTTVPVGPASPILFSPSQSTMGVGTSITLRWMSSEGAVSYKIHVSTSSTFSSNLVDQTLADTSYTVSTLSSSMTYYWRVQAIDISGIGNWSAVWSFATAGAGWKTSNVMGFFRSISFVGNQYGWMAGYNGVYATTDGGASWKSQATASSLVESICFVDSMTGWFVGPAGKIAKTINGGTQWTTQTSGTTVDLRGVSMSDANNGWAVAEKAILRTTNGGSSWEPQTAPVMQYIYGVKALSGTKGIVFGGNLVLRTTDGGATWISPSLPAYGFLQGCYFIDENTGWVVGADGMMFKTTNGGIQWSVVPSGTRQWITSIHFINAQQGWAVGWDGLVIKTTDAGTTWGRQLSGTTSSFYGVHFIDAFNGWAVGGQNMKTSDGGGVSFFAPVLLSPSAGATNTSTRPTFQWETAAGVVSYQLQVATSSYIYSGNIVINDSALTSTTRQTSVLNPNRMYYWRVLGYLIDGSVLTTPVWSFRTGSSSTSVEDIAGLPGTYFLYQNYPNPFNPSTAIEFDVPRASYVTLKIYNTLGNEAATLVASTLSPGRYKSTWNAANVSTGVYFCRMHARQLSGEHAGDFTMTKKVLLLK
ncbi:MAG: YCF48-related protein [Ignavibacteria bacterium]|nr:YCF48-related protein [Ignavibacteria bacterium]